MSYRTQPSLCHPPFFCAQTLFLVFSSHWHLLNILAFNVFACIYPASSGHYCCSCHTWFSYEHVQTTDDIILWHCTGTCACFFVFFSPTKTSKRLCFCIWDPTIFLRNSQTIWYIIQHISILRELSGNSPFNEIISKVFVVVKMTGFLWTMRFFTRDNLTVHA